MRKAIRVFGRVQGVWFRASAKEEADKLGICGYVRNEPDGSVYIEAEGPDALLDAFIKWCGKGPELAKVKSLEVEELKSKGENGKFEIIKGRN